MNGYFTYIRVSTARQAEHGVSLPEQRDSVDRYAKDLSLPITTRFEDHETAAVQGRPEFNRMLAQLRAGRAKGVIFYQVDRSSRNAGDWAKIEDLADRGLEVHFAQERLLLARRGDRMIAGVKAVMSADFIRALRERVTDSFYARLKQGLFPGPAPIGYLDAGGGKPKTIDPLKGPLVRELFELYGTGRLNLHDLTTEAKRLRLRGKGGQPLALTQLAQMLHNPFYAGVIRIKKSGQSYPGIHPPLVTADLFARVHNILTGRAPRRGVVHRFQFRRLLTCAHCHLRLIGERQKGRVYYRCHLSACPTTSLREDVAESCILRLMSAVQFDSNEQAKMLRTLSDLRCDEQTAAAERAEARRLRLTNVEARQRRLMDLYVDGGMERRELEQRKETLLAERRELDTAETTSDVDEAQALTEFLELAEQASLLYKLGLPDERRELVEIMTSNRLVDGRTPMFTLASPFAELAVEAQSSHGAPSRSTARTRSTVTRLLRVIRHFLASSDAAAVCQRVHGVLRATPTVKAA